MPLTASLSWDPVFIQPVGDGFHGQTPSPKFLYHQNGIGFGLVDGNVGFVIDLCLFISASYFFNSLWMSTLTRSERHSLDVFNLQGGNVGEHVLETFTIDGQVLLVRFGAGNTLVLVMRIQSSL